jgi:hypothetical protein
VADIGGPAYTPQPVDIVGDVSTLKRVLGGLLVSNPLQNAITTSGLMQWIGHYGQYFLWIGEFFPGDPNFKRADGSSGPQNGFVVRRDDSKQNYAYELYDYNPYQGGPLRQKIQMHDADGYNMFNEGEKGGWGWPRFPVPMGHIGYSNSTVDQVMASGRSQLVGRHLDFLFNLRSLGTAVISGTTVPAPFQGAPAHTTTWYVSVAIGSNTISTAHTTGEGFVQGTLDFGVNWQDLGSDFMLVDVHAWMSQAAGVMLWCEPIQFHSVTLFTDRTIEGF